MNVATIMDIFVSYGFETDDEMTDDRKLEALNETYWEVLAREAWPFLQSSVTLAFDGSTMAPNNDPGDINSVITAVRTDNGLFLEPWRMDDFYETYAGSLTTAGSPLLYFFEGGNLRVYPVPSSTDAVLIKYMKVAPELTALSVEGDILLPKRYHRSVLVMGTLSKLAVMQDDLEMGQGYGNLFEVAVTRMTDDLLTEQSQRTEFIHINDPDNWDYSA